MRKVYASTDNNRAIMVDDERGIIKSFRLNNVLCCEPEGLIESEELMEVSNTNFEWTEEDLTISDFKEKYPYTIKQISEKFNIPYRTVQNWYRGERECPAYIIKMMDTILKLEAR